MFFSTFRSITWHNYVVHPGFIIYMPIVLYLYQILLLYTLDLQFYSNDMVISSDYIMQYTTSSKHFHKVMILAYLKPPLVSDLWSHIKDSKLSHLLHNLIVKNIFNSNLLNHLSFEIVVVEFLCKDSANLLKVMIFYTRKDK